VRRSSTTEQRAQREVALQVERAGADPVAPHAKVGEAVPDREGVDDLRRDVTGRTNGRERAERLASRHASRTTSRPPRYEIRGRSRRRGCTRPCVGARWRRARGRSHPAAVERPRPCERTPRQLAALHARRARSIVRACPPCSLSSSCSGAARRRRTPRRTPELLRREPRRREPRRREPRRLEPRRLEPRSRMPPRPPTSAARATPPAEPWKKSVKNVVRSSFITRRFPVTCPR